MTVPSRRSKASRGFSLAEVLVALALLSVIILALFGLVTAGVQRAYGGKKMTEATILAQAVLERANVEAAYTTFDVAATATTPATKQWSMVSGVIVEAADTGGTAGVTERNQWRTMLQQSGLPGYTGSPATLTVTATPLPAGRSFGTAATVRIVVDVAWSEYKQRQRTVRLQTFNVRSTDL
jgi:prepilin-type N-terminal cleavage/methylation domain-containing protein